MGHEEEVTIKKGEEHTVSATNNDPFKLLSVVNSDLALRLEHPRERLQIENLGVKDLRSQKKAIEKKEQSTHHAGAWAHRIKAASEGLAVTTILQGAIAGGGGKAVLATGIGASLSGALAAVMELRERKRKRTSI